MTQDDIYKNGICECKAAGKWKYQDVGTRRILMCIKCGKPKRYPGGWETPKKKWYEYD